MTEETSKDNALKILVKASGISFFGMIFSQIILYLLRLVLARVLTPNEYGLLFLGFSLIYMLVFFVLLGLDGGIARYVPYYRAKKDFKRVKGVIITSLKISFPFSILVFLIMFFFSEEISVFVFHEPLLSPVIRIFSFIIPIFAIYKIFYSSLLSFKKIGYAVFSWYISRSLSTLLILLLFMLIGFGLAGVAIAYVLGFLISAVLVFFFMQFKVFPVFRSEIKSISLERKLLSFSLPIVVFSMLWNVMGRIDTVMIGIFKTSFDVGVYQAAMPTSQFLFLIPGALSGLFLPVISELLSKKKTEDIGKVYKTVSKWIFYLNFPLFLVFAIYPNAVINTLFGPEYIGAGNSLRILSIGYLVFSIGNLSSGMINLFEKTKYHILNAFLAVIAAVSLNYLLIPIYGIEGAAIANMMTFVIYTILPVIETYFISKHLPFHGGMLKSFVAGAVSITVVYSFTKFFFTDINIWILAPMFIIFLGIYSSLLLILRGLGEEDIMIMKAIEKKTGIKIDFLRKIIKKFI